MTLVRYIPVLLAGILFQFTVTGYRPDSPDMMDKASRHLVIESSNAGHRFSVEIADDPEERATGLMHRSSLPADAGMLFDFGRTAPVSMWMKNTLIPLDMAFIDQHGIIRHIVHNTFPFSLDPIPSGGPVRSVLEVNAGTFSALGIRTGDRVLHPVFGTHP